MPEQEQPQQPTYPQTGVQIQPNGMLITITLAPGLQLNQFLNEADMNTIAGQWLESRKQLKKELDIIADVNATKGRQSLKLLQRRKE